MSRPRNKTVEAYHITHSNNNDWARGVFEKMVEDDAIRTKLCEEYELDPDADVDELWEMFADDAFVGRENECWFFIVTRTDEMGDTDLAVFTNIPEARQFLRQQVLKDIEEKPSGKQIDHVQPEA